MTLTEDLTRTLWLVRAGQPLDQIAREERAKEPSVTDLPADRIAATLHRQRRECIPVLHVAADPRDVIGDTDRPAIARRARTLTEAARAYADAATLDGPDHGAAQAAAIDVAAATERRIAELIADAQRDGVTTAAGIAARLVAMGMGVRR